MEKVLTDKKRFSKNLLILSLTFMFVFPMSIFKLQDFFTINKIIFNLLVILIYLKYTLKKTIKLNFIDIIITVFMCFRFIITKDLESFGLSYLLVVRHLNFSFLELKRYKLLLYLLFFSIPIYTVLHRYYFSNYMISTSIGEINQVGFSLIMLYFIFRINNYKFFSKLVIICGIFTFSRNFFLAIILYLLMTKIFNKLKNKKISLKIPRSFQFYSIVSILVVFFLYYFFSQVTDTSQFDTYGNMWERFFVYFDNSNYQRFIANIAVINFYIFKPLYLFTGIPFYVYKEYLLEHLFGFGLIAGKINAPHNYFFKFLYKYGAFSFIVFILTAKVINKRLSIENLPIFITFLFYATFLGTGFYEAYLIILLYLLDKHKELK